MARDVVLPHPGKPDTRLAEVGAPADVLALPWHREVVQAAAAGEVGIVIVFLRVSLFIFALCGLGGLIVVAAFAAMAPGSDRIGALALLAIAFWVEVVLWLAVVSL